MAEPFQFELVSPERLLMSEPVEQVVVPGSEGYFTVLKGHAPFMSTLRPGVVDVINGNATLRIFVRGGFADVNPAGLTILAEQAIPLDEVDPAMLAQAVQNAEEDVADAKDGAIRDAAELRLHQLREVKGRSGGKSRPRNLLAPLRVAPLLARAEARMFTETGTILQAAADEAKAAGLTYVNDADPGFRRVKRGAGLAYLDRDGKTIRDRGVLGRIRGIAIPPAWIDVWIAPSARGHIQATGRDARGRKQYRYHADFRASREETKYEHIFAFADALRMIRRRVKRDMARHGLPRDKVIAAVVHLLDTTLIRVGNASYVRENHSYGLTTLRDKHVAVNGAEMRFAFLGKSGKTWQLKMRDRRVARIVKSCQELPGQHLFQYLDESGERQSIGSSDVNAYLREATEMEVTAKDFRTWAGTVLAATALAAYEPFDTQTLAKANLREAIEQVADRLGNTPTICRKCYIHPAIAAAYLEGALTLQVKNGASDESSAALHPNEKAVLALLKRWQKASKPSAKATAGRAT